jgi:hypothetical protein
MYCWLPDSRYRPTVPLNCVLVYLIGSIIGKDSSSDAMGDGMDEDSFEKLFDHLKIMKGNCNQMEQIYNAVMFRARPQFCEIRDVLLWAEVFRCRRLFSELLQYCCEFLLFSQQNFLLQST